MKSSQALVWSVFGNLRAAGRLGLLADLVDDDGRQLFPPGSIASDQLRLEYAVDYLGEPRPTSLDAVLDSGDYRVAIEGKLTEVDCGHCSRPALQPGSDPNYATDYCDGSYTRQRGRSERCTLSQIGVAYWRHIPALLRWSVDRDMSPCPLFGTYQLARNVLAACARPGERAHPKRGHAVLLRDSRNPQFGLGGAGWKECADLREALLDPGCVRMGTWQQLVAAIARDREVAWLAEELSAKYGFGGSVPGLPLAVSTISG